jgi:hypothetical protein
VVMMRALSANTAWQIQHVDLCGASPLCNARFGCEHSLAPGFKSGAVFNVAKQLFWFGRLYAVEGAGIKGANSIARSTNLLSQNELTAEGKIYLCHITCTQEFMAVIRIQ